MKIVVPVSLTLSMVIDTNATVSEAVWSSGASYTTGDAVYSTHPTDSFFHRYTALQDSGPPSDWQTPTGLSTDLYWLDEGVVMPHKAFDIRNLDGVIRGSISDKSENATTLTYEITPGTTFDCIGFFGVEGGSVQVQVIDNGESVVFDETQQVLSDQFVYDYPTYIKQGTPYQMRSEIVFDDLPGLVTDNTIQITITNTGDTARVGQIIIGETIEIGRTSGTGSGVGQEDYSSKSRNQFGQLLYTEGAYTKLNKYLVAVNTDEVARLSLLFGSLRGVPAIYMIDADTDQLGTTSLGVFNDWDLSHEAAGVSWFTVEVEGFT